MHQYKMVNIKKTNYIVQKLKFIASSPISFIREYCSADFEGLNPETPKLLNGGRPLILPLYLCRLWLRGLKSESESSSIFRLEADEEVDSSDRWGVVDAVKIMVY